MLSYCHYAFVITTCCASPQCLRDAEVAQQGGAVLQIQCCFGLPAEIYKSPAFESRPDQAQQIVSRLAKTILQLLSPVGFDIDFGSRL